MNKNDKTIVILGIAILILASIGIYTWVPSESTAAAPTTDDIITFTGTYKDTLPTAIKVSNENPFLALIATPIAVNYDDEGMQHIIPLYIENFSEPSRAVTRVESMINKPADLTIGCSQTKSITDISLELAETYWEQSHAALLIENNQTGYNLGVAATPLATYLRIPIIVTDDINQNVQSTLEELSIDYVFICGNISNRGIQKRALESPLQILDITKSVALDRFNDIDYITLTNPSDTLTPKVINTTTYFFDGRVNSNSFTPANIINMATGGLKGIPTVAHHEFDIPASYEYARVTIHAKNLVDEDISDTGSQLMPMFYDPEGNWLALAFTVGGIPERDSSGEIVTDQVTWDTIIYNNPGTYTLNVAGQFITSNTGEYEIEVTVEDLESAIVPNMPCLSSIAPYLTSYHKGILYADADFTFVGDEQIVEDPSPGVVFPASNPELIEYSNEHTFKIHESRIMNEYCLGISDL